MKLNGLVGGGTGKLGNSVFSQNAGRTIVRQYQSEVKNPNTARQKSARSRFAFVNALAKDFAAAIAIGRPRVGVLTSRNQFTKDVLPFTTDGAVVFENNDFVINWSKLPIAKGGMPALPEMTASYASETGVVTIQWTDAYDPEAAGYIPSQSGTAGMVFVMTNEYRDFVVVHQHVDLGLKRTTFTIGADYHSGLKLYAFGKWCLQGRTAIDMTTAPWKYPSDQSDSVLLGVTISQ